MIESQLLTESEAAEFLRLKPKTMARWRWAGTGPIYRKIGGAIRYAVTDLERYLEEATRQSTSQSGFGKTQAS